MIFDFIANEGDNSSTISFETSDTSSLFESYYQNIINSKNAYKNRVGYYSYVRKFDNLIKLFRSLKKIKYNALKFIKIIFFSKFEENYEIKLYGLLTFDILDKISEIFLPENIDLYCNYEDHFQNLSPFFASIIDTLFSILNEYGNEEYPNISMNQLNKYIKNFETKK
jgi:hypothetical protein